MKAFEIENGELKKYHGNRGNVVIPEGVTTIGEYAFRDCKSLKSITLPEGVTTIGEYAFRGCESLTGITLPESVIKIGEGAFYGCKSLTGITIPEGVTTIGKFTFFGCKSLTDITLPEGVTTIGELAFYNCKSLKSIIIPDSVTAVRKNAFVCGKKLKLFYQNYQFSPDVAAKINDNIFGMVREKDFSLEVNQPVKDRLILEMYLSVPEDTEIISYICEHIIEIFKLLIDAQDTDTARKIIESGQFITKENIDMLIQSAIDRNSHEIQLMLMDYKYHHIGFDDTESDIRKKFAL